MLNSILANVIAGLGLFFSGLRTLDANLRQATGRQLRAAIGRLTANRWTAALVGVVAGGLVQSSSGVDFILVSLVTSGLTTVPAVLPIGTWANVGRAALIFAAVLDLHLAILYLVGLAGVAFAFDRSHRSHVLGALFSVGLLFLGMEMMARGAEPLKDLPWFANALHGNRESLLLALAGGAAFSIVTQSSTAVSILAIGLARAGLLGPFPTMMAIYGAKVGSTIPGLLLSSGLKGSVRQVTAHQDLFRAVGVGLFVTMLYLEVLGGVPLVLAFVGRLSNRIDHQMAFVFLLFNLTTAILFTLLRSAVLRVLQWWLPADEYEDLTKPVFLYDGALNEPATAVDLIAQEQLRLTKRLRAYADAMRAGPGSAERAKGRLVHDPFAAVADRIEVFQRELVSRELGTAETDRLTSLQNRLNLLLYLEDSLRMLMVATESVEPNGRLGGVVSSFVEAIDFVLMTLVDALEPDGSEALGVLVRITGDRGDLMERIRQDYLADGAGVVAADRAVLWQATSIFERIIWMTQRLARLIEGGLPKEPSVLA